MQIFLENGKNLFFVKKFWTGYKKQKQKQF